MKTLLILLIISLNLTISALYSQETNCKKFRNGDFIYPTLENKITSRNDSIQKSYDNGKLEMIWQVLWLNDCEYNITCIEVLNENLDISIGDMINVKIVSTDESCYNSELVVFNAQYPKGFKIPNGPFPLCLMK